MTPKQILDSFSETLMQDERILSGQERALLITLLQHARSGAGDNPEIQEAVKTVICSAVGETVAQRAFSVLGSSIVERILENAGVSELGGIHGAEIYAGKPKEPQSPGKGPQTPGKAPQRSQPQPPPMRGPNDPQPPSNQPQPPMHTPLQPQPPSNQPQPPSSQPQPPRGSLDREVVAQNTVALLERPEHLPARTVVLDEFLAPEELQELTRFVLEREGDFIPSEVVSPVEDGGVVNYEHRRSRVLMDLKQHQDIFMERIQGVLPQVLRKLGMEEFVIAGVEAQVTASNDGDFFCFHNDNGSDRVASRYLTFVYFFHHEPPQFAGGELRIHDARLQGDVYVSEGSYHAIAPRQNQIVFFPCELLHEITPVKCPSGNFADSRFTLNGWLRR